MKPEWKNAPEWAQWLAQDFNGAWVWYATKPITMENGFWYASKWAGDPIHTDPNPDWRDTLEERP